MTWSYDTCLYASKDVVRLYIGDTNSSSQLFSNEEIEALLTVNSNDVFETAAQLADSLSGKYARSQSLAIDGFKIDYSDRASFYSNLATRLRRSGKTASGQFGAPFVSGVSESEMDAVRDNDDRVPNRLRIGQFDHPGTEVIEEDSNDEAEL